MLLDKLRQLPDIRLRMLFGNLHQVLDVQQDALNMLVLLIPALALVFLPQRHSFTCIMQRACALPCPFVFVNWHEEGVVDDAVRIFEVRLSINIFTIGDLLVD